MLPDVNLAQIRAVLLDMDGVVYVGERPIPGVQSLLDYLDRTGRKWLCITNNATRTPPMFVDKLARMGVKARPENVLGSAQATAYWLAQEYPQGGKAVVVGQEGLHAALEENGFQVITEPDEAQFAVVGMNFELTFAELATAALAIQKGSFFVGTNPDPTFPSERGLVPGAGSILKMLETATDVAPVIIGKPNPGMFQLAMARLAVTPEETLMVGDRYDTDIAGAIDLGMWTAGVLTGVTTRDGFEAEPKPPHLILDDVRALHRRFEAVDAEADQVAGM